MDDLNRLYALRRFLADLAEDLYMRACRSRNDRLLDLALDVSVQSDIVFEKYLDVMMG